MLVRHFIVTYNNDKVLHQSLETLKPTLERYSSDEYQLYVINNHSNFNLDDYYKDRITVLHNHTRPDFSTGHLTRNWNQCIINGFESLSNPACDYVIASQNDTTYTENFIEELIKVHQTFDLIHLGAGDTFMSYSTEAVKLIGLWDERFCNIGYQEADYFLRAYLYHRGRTTINDYYHGRLLNPLIENKITTDVFQSGHLRGEPSHLASLKYHTYQKQLYKYKWHSSLDEDNDTSLNWGNLTKFRFLKPKIDSYIYYPYFEKDIYQRTLSNQRYVGWRNF